MRLRLHFLQVGLSFYNVVKSFVCIVGDNFIIAGFDFFKLDLGFVEFIFGLIYDGKIVNCKIAVNTLTAFRFFRNDSLDLA